MSALSATRRFLLDGAIWFATPAAFLALYVYRYSFPLEAVIPHLRLVLAPFLFLCLTRIGATLTLRNENIRCAIGGSLAAALLLLLLAYYGLVLVGLNSWGQVVSWDLIRSYAAQAPALTEALGLPISLVMGTTLVTFIIASTALTLLVKRYDWTRYVTENAPAWLVTFLAGSTGLLIAIQIFWLLTSESNSHYEPVGLTLFPHQSNRTFQGHEIDRNGAERLDALEDQARVSYQQNEKVIRRNVILIVVDALRPANMSIYGYPRETTPHLAALTAKGRAQIVDGVRASCGESACGLYSIVSSKYVHQFSARPFSLYTVLLRHGYEIRMILGGDHTNFYGLKELYKEANNYFDGSQAHGYYVNDDQFVLDRTAALPAWNGQPTMLQYHLMSAHTLSRHSNRAQKYAPAANYILPQNRRIDQREKIVNYYDNGVVQADIVINDLLVTLEKKGYLKDALIVITADHGEGLGEHGLYSHANSVRDEIIRIPLIFLSYGSPIKAFDAQKLVVGQVDIAPTILYELEMIAPATWSGIALQRPDRHAFIFFQESFERGLVDLRDAKNTWKFWTDRRSGESFAFNLSRNAKEEDNEISSLPLSLRQEWLLTLAKLRPVEVNRYESFSSSETKP